MVFYFTFLWDISKGGTFITISGYSGFYESGVGDGLGSPLAGIFPNTEIRFFDDFSIVT